MKANDVTLLTIPDFGRMQKNHWQFRWGTKLSTAKFVYSPKIETINFNDPKQIDFFLEDWEFNIIQEIEKSYKPIVLIAHGLGILAGLLTSKKYKHKIKGGFFVAPPYPLGQNKKTYESSLNVFFSDKKVKDKAKIYHSVLSHSPYQETALDFPSLVIASNNDPYFNHNCIQNLAKSWNALLIDAGQAGHIDETTGHGPWPEGLIILAHFLKKLS